MIKAAFLSVVPSPYQRDLFAALARHPGIDLSVFYLERAAPDSPWPEKPLGPYERVLPGFWIPLGNARCHVNRALPRPRDFQVMVLNTLMSVSAQTMMRRLIGQAPWFFWGERLRPRGTGWRQALHDQLTAPLHRAAGIAGIGKLAAQAYAQRFPEPRHFNIPYFCALDPFLNAPRRAPQAETVFLFCGQMIARKGLDILLRAFARLVERNPAVRLRLVGREAELPEALKQVTPAARERIVYEGFQPPEELPRFFAQADVFVLPSRYDGWGVVVNQALAAGLPLLCSEAVGAAQDLIEEEVNGCLFPAGDAETLLARMERLASEPGLRERWGAASRKAAGQWQPEAGAARWVEAFETVLSSR